MDAQTIREKIVLCETIIDGSSIMEIGGEGITMKPIAFAMSLSFTAVVSQEAANVFIMDPKATIQFGQTWKGHSAPFVAEFYSRGEHINSDMFKKMDMELMTFVTRKFTSPISTCLVEVYTPEAIKGQS
ncbi:uncharacterized protein LOC120067120 isoform X3 [Benincasa hispida]|uniref:uncharacterized protein LOC120067120 isoform X3 n=1 Tax=Benincasa hispida TaxID=102211 RepID=UPI001900082A|nr:uncharacterized protein LOC120067120 isoform X3 [Benincasa hispida]